MPEKPEGSKTRINSEKYSASHHQNKQRITPHK